MLTLRPTVRLAAFLFFSLCLHAAIVCVFLPTGRAQPRLTAAAVAMQVRLLPLLSDATNSTQASAPQRVSRKAPQPIAAEDPSPRNESPPPVAVVPEPEYVVARRSRVFGGGARSRDTVAPPALHAPAVSVVHEGLARSVWSIVRSIQFTEQGHCELQAPLSADAGLLHIVCSSGELEVALANVPDAELASLSTWLRAGIVAAITLRFEAGRASYAMR